MFQHTNALRLTPENLTYGFEFEFIGNAKLSARKRFKSYMEQHDIPYIFTGKYGDNQTSAWTLGADGSVGGDVTGKLSDNGLFGYEMVSPILRQEDLWQIEIVLSGIREILGGYVDGTCGTHVHIGSIFNQEQMRDGNAVPSFFDSVVWLYAKLQPFLFTHLVKGNRGYNPFCGRYVDGMKEKNKYLALTARGVHGTLESRLHHGTLDAHEIIQWAEIHAQFITYCVNNGPHVQFTTLPTYHENGEINKETFLPFMTNLFVQFGYDEETAKSILEERIKNNEDAFRME